MRALCLFLLLATTALSAELARWSGSDRRGESSLELLKAGSDWKFEPAGSSERVAALIPVNDYYRRATFQARLAKPTPRESWLTVSYLDRGKLPRIIDKEYPGFKRIPIGSSRGSLYFKTLLYHFKSICNTILVFIQRCYLHRAVQFPVLADGYLKV